MSEKKKKNPDCLAAPEVLSSSSFDGLCSHYTPVVHKLQQEIRKNFQSKKRFSDYLSKVYYEIGHKSRALKVQDCGSFLEFKLNKEKAKLYNANFCKDRLCPMCNWRRTLKIFSQVSKVMDNMPDEYEFVFLTLTVRNCSADELADTVQTMYDGWRYLYNKNKRFKKAVQGTFRTFECTVNNNPRSLFYGTYHPHLHCTLAVKKDYFSSSDYITHEDMVELWQNACGLDYEPIVHIEKVYLKDEDGEKQTEGIDLKKAVAEATKYAVKSSDYLDLHNLDKSCETVQTFLSALSGRRLCSWSGIFSKVRKQLQLDDAENGDLIYTNDDTIRDDVASLIVRYQWKSGVYSVTKIEEESLRPCTR